DLDRRAPVIPSEGRPPVRARLSLTKDLRPVRALSARRKWRFLPRSNGSRLGPTGTRDGPSHGSLPSHHVGLNLWRTSISRLLSPEFDRSGPSYQRVRLYLRQLARLSRSRFERENRRSIRLRRKPIAESSRIFGSAAS